MSEPLSDFRLQSASAQPAAATTTPANEYPYQSPDSPEAPQIEMPDTPAYSPLEAQIAAQFQQGKRGASWFYSIAGFSLINSIIVLFGGGTYFVIGLGVTVITDHFAVAAAQQSPDAAVLVKGGAFAFDLFVAAALCAFGWLSVKRWQPVFILGMTLYLLDGLLFLMFGRMMAVAFHAYGLYCMWSGFQAYRRLADLERQLMDPLHPAGMLNPHQAAPLEGT
ncbi:MAG TPA: hypothetical protein VFV87_20530 [Pirellulaceae bacterium]|nr:hypothetical protein [Pirellulaceae bacterium]